jgi:cell division protein FtsW
VATLTPQGQTASGHRATSLPSSQVARVRRSLSAVEVLRWLRSMLDRPLTSYHLVLGSVALLLIVGVMMVLSASSVNAYLTVGDS